MVVGVAGRIHRSPEGLLFDLSLPGSGLVPQDPVISRTGEPSVARLEWEGELDEMGLEQTCTLLLAVPALAGAVSLERPVRELAAWVTYWDLESGVSRLVQEGGSTRVRVNDAFVFAAALTPDGKVTLAGDERATITAVAELESRGARVWLTLVNDVLPAGGALPSLKDPAIVHGLLEAAGRAERHERELVALARRIGVSGIDIDYENLAFEDRAAFTRFVAGLSTRTQAEGLLLSVTVQPKTGESRSPGPGGTDWSGVCPFIDRLQVMLYNLHSGATPPGPMATKEWIEKVLEFATSQCPASRVVPAVKLSGMDWGPGRVQGIQYERAMELARRQKAEISRDPSGAPYFAYRGPDGRHTVFFEDAASIEDKLQSIERLGFDRVILWSVGREDPRLLPRLGSR